MKKRIPYKSKHQKVGGTILISDKVDFKTKSIIRNKEKHFKMTEETIHKKT